MRRWALFVDAGWLFAGGSTAAFGGSLTRSQICWQPDELVPALADAGRALVSPDAELLRTYWYDGSPNRLPTGFQLEVARQSDVKLRLGRSSRQGQKGVDGLIIHDLITHAYRRTIDDAVVISGDEDLLDAIESAQANGTRVHLLEIPIGGIAEAMLRAFDKIAELDGEFFKQFFTEVVPEPEVAPESGLSDDAVIDLVAAEAATEEIKRQPAPPKEKPKWMNLPLRPIDSDSAVATVDLEQLGEISDRGATFAEEWMAKSRGDERAELLASRPYLGNGLDAELLRFAADDKWLSDSERRALRDAFWNRLAEG